MITEKIKNIFFKAKNDLNEEMKPYGLTAVQIILLKYLNENSDKTIIQRDICDFLSLRHSTVISILKRMEAKELITKKSGYKSEIAITEKGQQVIKLVGAKKVFFENRLLTGFSEEEVDNLTNYLDRIYSNINNN